MLKNSKLIDVKDYFDVDLEHVKEYSKNKTIYLDENTVRALLETEKDLPSGYGFIIMYGHRTLEEQTEIVKKTEKELKQSHPDNWEELLKKYTGGYEELKLKIISPMNHRSGMAVDLKLSLDGKEIDLGGEQMDERDKLDYYENKSNLSKKEEQIRDNRRLLKILQKHGFKNYKDEWWHWGYIGEEKKAIKEEQLIKNASPAEKEIQRLFLHIIPGTMFEKKVFSVGGYERDALLGKESKDLDIVVEISGGSEKLANFVKHMFPEETTTPRQLGAAYPIWHIGFKEDVTHKDEVFKTKGGEIDIADTQKESYPDPTSRQRVTEFATLPEDVQRRDFTVNMLLRDLSSGEIVDLTGTSKEDIEKGILRGHPAVSPDKMFSEDPLRMMRLIRFQVKYDWDVPLSMVRAVKHNAEQIQKISWERIQEELIKMMKLGKMARAVQLMKTTGLLTYVLPEVYGLIGVQHDPSTHQEGDVYKHTLLVLSNAPPTIVGQLSALLHDIGKPKTREFINNKIHFYGHEEVGGEIAEAILRRLKFDNSIIKTVRKVVESHMRPIDLMTAQSKALRKFVRDIGDEIIESVLDLARADALGTLPPKDYIPELRAKLQEAQKVPIAKKPILNGEEIMTLLNITPGPKIKEVMTYLKEVEDEFAEKNIVLTKDVAQQKVLEKFASDSLLVSKFGKLGQIADELLATGESDLDKYFQNVVPNVPQELREYLNTALPHDVVIIKGMGEEHYDNVLRVTKRNVLSEPVMGRWIHVVNTEFTDLKSFLTKFTSLQGEVCFSSPDSSSVYLGGDFVAVIMDGPARAAFSTDAFSDYDQWTGRRYSIAPKTPKAIEENVEEAWVVPAKAKLIGILTDDPKIAKEADEMGVMAVGSKPLINREPFEDELSKHAMTYEEYEKQLEEEYDEMEKQEQERFDSMSEEEKKEYYEYWENYDKEMEEKERNRKKRDRSEITSDEIEMLAEMYPEEREAYLNYNFLPETELSKKASSFAWTKPELAEETSELLRVAMEEGISYDSLKRSFKHGIMRPLDRKVWEHLENTDSLQVRTLEEAITFAENYGKSWVSIKQAFERNWNLPAPIVLERDNGSITLVAGNTRLAFARAYHVKPYVYWIKETELFNTPNSLE